jgi:hypothetical protein
LQYPREWGERAFRGWLVFETFHNNLEWPIPNIVFGETFDVLFINGPIKTVIYLETKKPERGLADLDEFRGRLGHHETLQWAILTDGYKWMRLDCVRDEERTFSIQETELVQWKEFFRVFRATNFIYGV